MKNYIGLNIKYLCDKNYLSQRDFASIFGITQAVVNAYIKEKSNPQVETIQKICKHFEITIDDFINLELSSAGLMKTGPVNTTLEPTTKYQVNDTIIESLKETVAMQKETIGSQKETIEAQRELINSYKQQLGNAS